MADIATELRAIRVCVAMLQTLSVDERRRVTDYLSSRYHDPSTTPEPVTALARCPIDGRFLPVIAPASTTQDTTRGEGES